MMNVVAKKFEIVPNNQLNKITKLEIPFSPQGFIADMFTVKNLRDFSKIATRGVDDRKKTNLMSSLQTFNRRLKSLTIKYFWIGFINLDCVNVLVPL